MDILTSYFLPFEIFNVLKLLVNNEVVICIKSIHKCLNYVIFKKLDACKGCTNILYLANGNKHLKVHMFQKALNEA